ncbi:hypothetical protein HCN44_011150 [Aphidius gifuensis]|uniref:Peptidase S1 domain-containing protein n=1 Tax=Aphidius gifuensis TaxID=684658 RepID=A0A834XW37_APHGI|nr:hypothetical protein HCN44_011150 [Aphidius gifuensis]
MYQLMILLISSIFIQDVRGIVGGVDSNIIDLPYQVSLRRSSQHICGGAIISDRHILTAGHCIAGIFSSPFTELTVASGSSTLNGPANVHFVDNVIVHPGYVPRASTQRVKNDIAIIILENSIKENEFQSRIYLPNENTPSGIVGVVSGWGRTSIDSKSSIVLKKASVNILSSMECLEQGELVGAGQLCGFSGLGSGTCKGDSGGPLVFKNTIIGIVSTSDRECLQNVPHTYTRVFTHLKFIKTTIAEN